MSRTSKPKRSSIVMPSIKEDKAVVAAARRDPDAKPLTASRVKTMTVVQVPRGRPKSENRKLLLSVRYSPEVIAFFKSTGDGWQSQMDGVLRQYVARQSRRG